MYASSSEQQAAYLTQFQDRANTEFGEMNRLLSQYSTELKKSELEDTGAAMRIEELERMNMVNLWFMPMVS